VTGSDFDDLSAEQMLRVSRLCDDFERAWQAGDCPTVERYLADVEPQVAVALLRELVPLEINYRRRIGQSVSRDEYRTRFPAIDATVWERLFEAAATMVEPLAEIEPTPIPPVLGDYAVQEKIGGGGMGAVYKALHQRMGRVVALKVLRPDIQRDPALLRRFDREVRAAARLVHPNIVAALDARENDGIHFLITEFVDGEDLDARVRGKGPLGIVEAIDCITQAARGLDYAHRQGVIHRDIKPANLLIDSQGTVKVLDMGLARFDAGDDIEPMNLTRSGMVMGTPLYMAPEQARDTRKADARSDVYSLGCTLYFLLTGKPVYHAENAVDTILSHVSQPIPSLAAANPKAPAELDQIFRKLVAKKPEERFQTAQEVVAVLERFRNRYVAAVRSAKERGVAKAKTSLAGPVASPVTPVKEGKPAPVIEPAGKAVPAGGESPVKVVIGPAPVRPGSFSDIATSPLPPSALPPLAVPAKHSPSARTGQRMGIAIAALLLVCLGLGAIYWISGDHGADTPPISQGGERLPATPPELTRPIRPNPETDPEKSLMNDSPTVRVLLFNGNSSYVAVPTLTPEAGETYTLEAFARPTGIQTSNLISWLGPNWMALYMTGGEGWGVARLTASRPLLTSVGRDVELNRWVHVAGVCEGEQLRLFVDGRMQTPRLSEFALPETRGGLHIGGIRPGLLPADHSRFFQGAIAAVRISRGARYTTDFTVPAELSVDERTIALFDFRQGTGNEVIDLGPQHYRGEVVSAEWRSP
jgi:serine/threonine protein kinase